MGTATQVALARFSSRRVALVGLGLFLVALALIVAALAQAAPALFLAGRVVGGMAVGAIFLGSLAIANRLAPPERRGHAISAFFVACYAGLIIPVVGVGVLSGFTGTFPAPRHPVPVLLGQDRTGPRVGHGGKPMTSQQQPPPTSYQIRVRGHLGATMLRAFPALYAEAQGQDTLLRGAADRAALHGVRAQIEALGLELLEVRRVPPASREPTRAVSPVTAKQLNGR